MTFPRPWKYRVNIKRFLNPGGPLAPVRDGIRKELAQFEDDPDYRFEEAFQIMDEAVEIDDVGLFDDGLALLYDWADDKRVWMGVL